MATIKAIDGRSVGAQVVSWSISTLTNSTQVHQIQSGQVIVDLCSVVKEVVENGVDAGATIIGTYEPTNSSPHINLAQMSGLRIKDLI